MTAAVTAAVAECMICPPRHRRPSRDGGRSCWPCHDRLHEYLGEIVDRYAVLTPRPGRGGDDGRRAPGFRSTPPLDLHIVALRDMRTRKVLPGDPLSALRVLTSWAQHVRRSRGQDLVASASVTVMSEAGYLRTNLDWVTRQLWLGPFAREVANVRTQLRASTGEPTPRPIGRCIAQLEHGECRHALYAPHEGEGEIITCRGCDSTYDPLAQVRLRLANEADDAQDQPEPCACGHTSTQHDNDAAEARRCNAKWCDCPDYAP